MVRLIRSRFIACVVAATALMLAGCTPPRPSAGGQMLVASDLHFNPMDDPALTNQLATADPAQWSGILDHAPPGFGRYGRDTDWRLLHSALDQMQRVLPDPDLVMLPGDFLAHEYRQQFDASAADHSDAAYRNFVQKTMIFIAQQVRQRFPRTPVLTALGNNDDVCGDYMLQPEGPFLWDTLPVVRRLSDRLEAGFGPDWISGNGYDVPHPFLPGVRIVFVNTVFLSRNYENTCGTPGTDPGAALLDWLGARLEDARRNGKAVWLLYHIPPGIDAYATLHRKPNDPAIVPMWKPAYTQRFLQLTSRYAGTISASFAGHTHMDEFRLIGYGAQRSGFVLVTPAISPIFGQNPAFRTVTYTLSGSLSDQTTWYLANLPAAGTQAAPEWKKEYRFTRAWNLPGLGLRDLEKLWSMIGSSRAARAQWQTIFPVSREAVWKLRPGEMLPDPVFRVYQCTAGTISEANFAACMAR